uniref:Uncharacterized protein n=1 Tax=Anguilla anguilla TaxID=7936 RepID=A0A0E9T7D3_ANGAN
MKRNTRIRYIRIPTRDFGKILGEGNIYVTVFVENRSYDDDDCKMISQNFFIPSNKSFIVTANHNIKFQSMEPTFGRTSKATTTGNSIPQVVIKWFILIEEGFNVLETF